MSRTVAAASTITPERDKQVDFSDPYYASRQSLIVNSTETPDIASTADLGEGPPVVREKVHAARQMTLDQALYEMELVGHDFYLFVDKESERPSVVYRRRGYDYGVISLDLGPVG